MKIYLSNIPPTHPVDVLTIGECYEADLVPTITDPQTLQPAPPSYIVKCNDNKWRKINAEYFYTQEEWREQQINKII